MTGVLGLLQDGSLVRWFVARFDSISDVDYSASKMLLNLIKRLQARHVTLVLSDVSTGLRSLLQRYGLVGALGGDKVFVDCLAAIREYRKLSPDAEASQWQANAVPLPTSMHDRREQLCLAIDCQLAASYCWPYNSSLDRRLAQSLVVRVRKLLTTIGREWNLKMDLS